MIKPLAFDLETEEGIQEKSSRNFGYLTLLNQTAKEKNYIFDILVSTGKKIPEPPYKMVEYIAVAA